MKIQQFSFLDILKMVLARIRQMSGQVSRG